MGGAPIASANLLVQPLGICERNGSGVVDGRSVEASFSLRDGCEIAAWNAAKDVLGTSAGAV